MLTPQQADEVAERIAQRLLAAIDRACPVPEVVCRECRGRGFWLRDGDLVFCARCEAGRARRRRQAVMNRMVAVGYEKSRRRRL